MKRLALFVALALGAIAVADTLHITTPVNTVPALSTDGIPVDGVQNVAVTLADYRDGGAGDSDTITNCGAAAYLWTTYTSSAFSGKTGVWTRAPQFDVTCVNGDAGTNGLGQTFLVTPANGGTLQGRLYYTVTTFTGADSGTPVPDITIQTR